MQTDLRQELGREVDSQRRRRMLVAVAGLVVGAIVIGMAMMALVVAVVPNEFVDSSFVNGTEKDVVIYVNGEGRAVAGPGATVSNFALFPRDATGAVPRYVVQAYALDFEKGGCTSDGGCEGELRHCAVYTWGELSVLNWVAQVTENVVPGQGFGDVPLDRCP